MSITKDFLPKHPEVCVYQDDEMFRMNTDTMVLGEFLEVYRHDTILDIGTNQGVLLLYASFFGPQKMIGIDINERALDLAQRNMIANNIQEVEFHQVDAATYCKDPVDVIVCNPPYFQTKDDEKGKNPYLNLAKHEGELTLSKLIHSIDVNLKPNGKVYFLYQTSRLHEVMDEFLLHHMQIKVLKFIYDVRKEISNVVLIKAIKGGLPGLVVQKPIIITRTSSKVVSS
ncbi:MAG: methyltransferase [Bacilli bacterium]